MTAFFARQFQASAALSSRASAFVVILFGTALVYGAAFAGPDILHNAAHDTRHVIATPCH